MVVADMDFDAVECQSDSDPLQVLLSRQSAEGWFEDDATIAALFSSRGIDRAKVEAVLTAVLPASPERAKITRTLVVLYLLEKAFAAQEDLWRRGQRKAMRWVSKVTGWSMTTVANRVQAV